MEEFKKKELLLKDREKELSLRQGLLDKRSKQAQSFKDREDFRLIFEKSRDLHQAHYIDRPEVPSKDPNDFFAKNLLRSSLPIPTLGELQVVRHFSLLSERNFSVDSNFYPLGSCTMKYNPKINDELSDLSGFIDIHPLQCQQDVQGALQVIFNLEQLLCRITGLKRFSMQPSSGAQGELCGMLMIKKFHQISGKKKNTVIIPDSAHGTNPATAAMCGFKIQIVKSNSKGLVDLDYLNSLVSEDTAAMMLTNPNTLGLFEENITEIAEIIHKKGGFLYYDGANLNPLMGFTNPGLMGFDVAHFNLHKTFSTPHGCGGPGAGVIGVGEKLIDFLPVPLVGKKENIFYFDYSPCNSIGRLRSFYGNFSILVRAYAYILRLGERGLARAASNSVLNANYIKEKLKKTFDLPYDKTCMHEVVFSCSRQRERGASALDIAKRLIDYGIHPPTMYFPLIVKEALMIEPTETESKQTLDYFIKSLEKIDREIDQDLQNIKDSPHTSWVKRVDEVKAARFPDLRCKIIGD
ncbi:MAG: aminomethyl-transferring glycine dehydrogenase subunit GcvPB [Candidatus Omnitrophica bacterium]|nr:aminomethyl-transferring glycine dehydrogenase subunit GcvPB [Candidatus Omnitrophota bacterium]